MASQVSTSPMKEPLLSLSSSSSPSPSVPTLVPAAVTPSKTSTGSQCSVCDDVAQTSTVFRRHYGVICCEACKCFFRRTVQMGREYKCRFSGSCPIGRNAINIKQVCQACRFNRCTQAGMKIDSVKKFPRKMKDEKVLKNRKKPSGSLPVFPRSSTESNNDTSSNRSPTPPTASIENKSKRKRIKQEEGEEGEEDIEGYESDFEQFKFNVSSPELSSIYSNVIETGGGGRVASSASIPKLFSGESLENIHEKSSIPTPSSTSEEYSDKRSPQVDSVSEHSSLLIKTVRQQSPLVQTSLGVPHSNGRPSPSSGHVDSPDPQFLTGSELQTAVSQLMGSTVKQPAANVNWNEMLIKKQRLEDALNHITARQIQVKANLQRLTNPGPSSLSPLPPATSFLPLSAPNPLVVLPGGLPVIKQETTPYATPHETPHGTPVPSPLPPSPHMSSYAPVQVPPQIHHYSHPPTPLHPGPHQYEPHPLSQPGTPLNSLPTSPTGFKPLANSHSFFYQSNTYPYSYPVSPTCMRVGGSGGFSQTIPPIPLINGATPYPPLQYNGGGVVRGGASMPGSAVTSPINRDPDSALPSPSFTRDSQGKLAVELIPETHTEPESVLSHVSSRHGSLASAPPSNCPSPQPARPVSDAPEAEVEEVLESLKRSIKHMFKWAKSEVKDFDDLSPMDQKALLRRTVPELVMLGFARASTPYDDMLLLGSTGKVLGPTNSNSGVSAVAYVTLTKLVVPLKVLNMDDQELKLMKQIVLFNPESNCLRDKETVREYRKRRHIELMEYSEHKQPGRFGELLCLLTPLYEVSTEVTEQLRLEQFVHEGEARIDALLLMSMINQGGGTTEETVEAGDQVM
ncbi:PREDICTED: nuclear receptor 2 isoform X1 [Amphimedon queenslandica]|uniref:Nuclear receptor domain-containing protein n=1 Tax=Amphimedon queenslandica TaxID=400682 RepID=A0A1X7VG16_AMPQE|nr:PREDICTED: nuclear receptor 2 isoform X1 [Amphimedon queenslandica]|eukprot:XP_019849288.1 PREDICTED: nuclear receptor 2 isoform X1 [Amphimedon queenslandica]